jgi:hypothetical protein
MADGWRNRYMAPFYALAISFVLVLLLGFTLTAPGSEADPTAATPTVTKTVEPEPVESSLRFSSKENPFPATVAIVWWDNERRTVKSADELNKLRPTAPVRVCALMAKGWVALKADKLEKTDYMCWGPLEPRKPGEAITIDVGKDG